MTATARKPPTLFEEFASELMLAHPEEVKNTTDAINMAFTNLVNAKIQMCEAKKIADFQEAGDVWFSAYCVLFSYRHFQ